MLNKINWHYVFVTLMAFWFFIIVGMMIQKNIDQKQVNEIAEKYNNLYAEYKDYKAHSWELKYY